MCDSNIIVITVFLNSSAESTISDYVYQNWSPIQSMSASHMAKEYFVQKFLADILCFILGYPKATPYVFKLALKNDDGGGRKNSPLDGACCLS